MQTSTHGILIALSSKRLALLESEPETLEDVVEARHEGSIPGLLDLKTLWEALDMIMSGRGRDEILGDALLARTGKNLDVDTAFEQARVLSPQRVSEVAGKLAELSPAAFRERATQLGKTKQLDELARKEILFLTSCTVDFRSLVRALIAGPRVRPGERRAYVHHDGRVGDVYLSIMRAVAMDPPRLSLDYAELMRRLDLLCKGASPDGASVVNACGRLSQIAGGFSAPTGPSFEWDEQAQVLDVPDPYLLFYLRWSVALEREADALM